MAASLSLVTLVYRQSLHIGKTPTVWRKDLGSAMSGLALHKCVVAFVVDQDHASLISFCCRLQGPCRQRKDHQTPACLRWCWQTCSLPDIIQGIPPEITLPRSGSNSDWGRWVLPSSIPTKGPPSHVVVVVDLILVKGIWWDLHYTTFKFTCLTEDI